MSPWLRLCLAGLAITAMASACSGKSHSGSRTPGSPSPGATAPGADTTPRPAGVPTDAARIVTDRSYGATMPGGEPPHLYAMSCRDGVLTIITSQILQMYAELPCDRAVPQNVANRFIGHPVTLQVAFGAATKIHLLSPVGGTIEFTVGRVWVKG